MSSVRVNNDGLRLTIQLIRYRIHFTVELLGKLRIWLLTSNYVLPNGHTVRKDLPLDVNCHADADFNTVRNRHTLCSCPSAGTLSAARLVMCQTTFSLAFRKLARAVAFDPSPYAHTCQRVHRRFSHATHRQSRFPTTLTTCALSRASFHSNLASIVPRDAITHLKRVPLQRQSPFDGVTFLETGALARQ